MKKVIVAVLLILVIILFPYPNFATTQYDEQIINVIDADTYEIKASWNPYDSLKWKVRLAGVDAPEKGNRAKCRSERILQQEAKAFVERLFQSNNVVMLENVKHDKFGGRIVADVRLSNGDLLSDELIKNGYAKKWNGKGDKPEWCPASIFSF